ncbi:MAG: single-stranded-DNA-specific exonuclease RecJ, partial [Gammaproteobacteria bacterium]|nr:single-stranded-DNA-specific exonuclease RecJ [Gammaproteobacteria bacterium]
MDKVIKRIANPENKLDNFSSILNRIYGNRNIQSADELDYSVSKLLPYEKLKGINEAAFLIADAIKNNLKIVIVGDFDVDGATSTTVAVKALQSMGAGQVEFLVPNRFEYGYGLTPEIVQVALDRFKPDVIITVDNGISSIEGVKAAKGLNIKVIVTDHHLPGQTLPAADAIVNPNQPGDEFPSKMLAGVGVIFYVMLALRSLLREQGWFEERNIKEPNLAELLDLVALGTVADVVPLDYNNRILVSQGLARIRSGKVSMGIKALIDITGRDMQRLIASDFGFAIAPRLNAAGRLDDMSLGIHCLLSNDITAAHKIAQQLDDINHARRDIESDMKQQALKLLDEMHLDENMSLPFGLCLFDQSFHEGVVGIIASRIKDRWHRPVIVFAKTEDNCLKGSGRSVKGLHIRDALDSVAASHPDLITKFGGHAMAAGLTIAEENYELFTRAFDAEVRRHLDDDDLKGVVLSDGELSESELNLQTAEEIRYAGPWGQTFQEPVFDGLFDIISKRIVGEKHLKMSLQPHGSQLEVDAIAFNTTDEEWSNEHQQAKVAYRLDVNVFRGRQNLQLMVE